MTIFLSFGVFGLLDAIDRFEISKGFSFQTFAVPRIRGAILDELRKYDWISRTGREKLQKLGRAMETVLQEKGALSDSALMEAMGMEEKKSTVKPWSCRAGAISFLSTKCLRWRTGM